MIGIDKIIILEINIATAIITISKANSALPIPELEFFEAIITKFKIC
jgi:hypothetical protein